MTNKNIRGNGLREGVNNQGLIFEIEKLVRKQQTFRKLTTDLFDALARGLDSFDARTVKRLDQIEKKLDDILKQHS